MDRNAFTVGWICALARELEASTAVLDQVYASFDEQDPSDSNTYTYGRIGTHMIAMACLPEGVYGTVSAATVASHMQRTFPALRFGLMVGIGGGIWTTDNDVRLGDVVVSTPTSEFDAVIQYDLGKAEQGGQFKRRGSLNKPPIFLLSALGTLRSKHSEARNYLVNTHVGLLSKTERSPNDFSRPSPSSDVLYLSECHHPKSERCQQCGSHPWMVRELRLDKSGNNDLRPELHYGLIGSGNRVIADAQERTRLRNDAPILCFEMEAAGLVDSLPFLIIRGICDYADSYKHDEWQNYAAAMAASYARLLLETVPAVTVPGALTARQISKVQLTERLQTLARNAPLDPVIKEEIHFLESDQSLLIKSSHYWSHMTEQGFRHYESIVRRLPLSHEGSSMDILSFATRLASSSPEASHLIDIWERFGKGVEARLPRNAILAVLYMLHVECFDFRYRAERLRRYDDGTYPISRDRELALRCFGRWERCPHSSTCPILRNFANNSYGLARQVPQDQNDCVVHIWCEEKIRSAGKGGEHSSALTAEEKDKARAGRQKCQRAWGSQPQDIL